eukprot:CAMPEP_0172901094 /NCGR_PEP_ID=MMETSP1075-20121228/165559_1 /TAXON_ID=2916 /ORGANISM="Ceratium fusus, Strain PA161109" /LENGTH=90 /DNA_ID=CAMNT_0013757423 /DNA_START=9 /DNA_END=278 /DNA_ORIENTATION=+
MEAIMQAEKANMEQDLLDVQMDCERKTAQAKAEAEKMEEMAAETRNRLEKQMAEEKALAAAEAAETRLRLEKQMVEEKALAAAEALETRN